MQKWIIACFMSLSAVGFAADNADAIKRLTDIASASGFEKNVRQVMQSAWQPDMKELKTDGMGNLLGQHKNNHQGPKVLLMAHMDEVGLMVESITPEGFIRVVPLGGVASSILYAQRWQIETPEGKVLAYSGMDSPHLLDDQAKMNGIAAQTALFLDIGAHNKQEAEEQFHIRPGLQVTPASEMTALSPTRYLAKALDDRLGLALISDVLANIRNKAHPNQLSVAATVQEEIGLRGASVVYEGTHPDVVINVEVGIADDYPKLLAERKGRISLGKGPSLFVYDRTLIPNQGLLNWIMKLAQSNHIPVQLEVESGYGEDAAKLQASGPGVLAINVGIPIRYAHQQAGIFDTKDYQQAVQLVTLIVEKLNEQALTEMKQG